MKRPIALAVGVLAFAPGRVSAFVRSHVAGDGPPLVWCSRKIPFVVNDKGSSTGGSGTFDSVAKSFNAWSGPSCTDLAFENRGTTSRTDVGFDPTSADNLNLVIWRERACATAAPTNAPCFQKGGCANTYNCWDHDSGTIALTTMTYNNKNGMILDADIELNATTFVFTTVDSPPCTASAPPRDNSCVATDIQNTVTHEVGHVIGLDHVLDVPDATMSPYADVGEMTKRTLHQDDIDGLCTLYPKAQVSPACHNPPAPQPTGGCSSAPLGMPLAGMGFALLAGLRALGCRPCARGSARRFPR